LLIKWLVISVLAFYPFTSVHIPPPAPTTPPHPPQPTELPDYTPEFVNAPTPTELNLPPLKAVLLVGPIDGDYGSWTTQEKHNMDLAAAELEANGVQVHKFYPPDQNWEQIKAAANGAHFLLYRGHGVYWSPMPNPTVGGFALKNKFVSAQDIRNELALAPNAIVMLYGCFTAGSSSADGGPISSTEAQRRVAQYSDPFFDIGAGGYYANWFGNAFQMYLRYLFEGRTLGEAYTAYFDFNAGTVERYMHPDHPTLTMWLDKDNWGYTQYNNAFAGQPALTLEELFPAGEIGLMVSPSTIVDIATPASDPHTFQFQVEGSGSDPITWHASIPSAESSWLNIYPASGTSGDWITVVITPTGKTEGVYQTEVQVSSSTGGADAAEQVPVTLHVLDQVFALYLPIAARVTPP
jgi:hypothetical protein